MSILSTLSIFLHNGYLMNNTNSFDKYTSLLSRIYDKSEQVLSTIRKKKSCKYTCWVFVVFLFSSILFLLNVLTPMIADDFGYLLVYRENTPIHSLADIFRSQYNHYRLWGGRSVVHFIAQVLLQLPPVLTDMLNTFVYMLYIWLIYLHIKGRKAHSILLFVFINFAVWLMQPAFGDTILWVIGSANYLWGTTIILLCLLPFRLYDGMPEAKGKIILKSVLLFFFSLLAGWTNENTAAAMLGMMVLFLIYYRSRLWRIPIWAIISLVGSLITYIVMILAPGNTLRAGDAGELSLFIICYRLFIHTMELCTTYGVLNVLYVILFILYWKYNMHSCIRKDTIKLSLIYLLGVVGGVYVMVFSPSFPPRAWFGVLTLYIIAIGQLLYNLNYEYRFLRIIRSSLLIFGLLAFTFTFYTATKDVYGFYNIFKDRDNIVQVAKAKGDGVCEFDRFVSSSRFVHSEDPTANFLMWDYYGIEVWYTGQKRY